MLISQLREMLLKRLLILYVYRSLQYDIRHLPTRRWTVKFNAKTRSKTSHQKIQRTRYITLKYLKVIDILLVIDYEITIDQIDLSKNNR